MRFYQNISCIFCNSSNFDRQHLLSEYTISKKILQQLSIHTHFFARYGNWEELWLYDWKKGRLEKEGSLVTIFIIYLTEIYYNYYKKLANNSAYIDYKIIISNFKRRLVDHIKISILRKTNTSYINKLQNLCNKII